MQIEKMDISENIENDRNINNILCPRVIENSKGNDCEEPDSSLNDCSSNLNNNSVQENDSENSSELNSLKDTDNRQIHEDVEDTTSQNSDLNYIEDNISSEQGMQKSCLEGIKHTEISDNNLENEFDFDNINTTIDLPNKTGNEAEIIVVKKKIQRILDSDDEYSDNLLYSENGNTSIKKSSIRSRKPNIIDSDSDEEKDTVLNDNSNNLNEAPIYCTDNKGNPFEEASNRSRLLAICDPETSDEDSDETSHPHKKNSTGEKEITSKTKQKPTNDAHQKKITGRDAQKLKMEIQSESQRMTRESSVALPYHRPKPRTLKDFLQNRSRFATAVPSNTSNTPPSLAIKMSTDQLKAVYEKLSEREKEVEMFFKSESESEGEEENEKDTEKDNENQTNSVDENETNICKQSESGKVINGEEIMEVPRVCILQNILLNTSSGVVDTHQNLMVENPTNAQSPQDVAVINKEHVRKVENAFTSDDGGMPKDIEQKLKTFQKRSGWIEHGNNFVIGTSDEINFINADEKIQHSIPMSNDSNNSVHSEVEDQEGAKQFNEEIVNKANESDSPDFEFSMDNVDFGESKSQNVSDSENLKLDKLIAKYTSHEFVTDNSDEPKTSENKHLIEKVNSKSLMDLVKNKFGNFKPEIKGNTNEVIDLGSGTTKLNEIDQLLNRFIKHTKKKSPAKYKTKLDIISLSGGEIHKETVEMSVNDEEQFPITEKPGERLKRLRQEPQMQMAQRRSELWQQRSDIQNKDKQPTIESDKVEEFEKEDILDNENEEDCTDSEEEHDDLNEDDNDEDDNDDCNDKLVSQNYFIDNEAEESDVDDTNPINEADEDTIEKGYHLEDTVSEGEKDGVSGKRQKKKKRLKRIIQTFSNDSEDEESNSDNNANSESPQAVLKTDERRKNEECQFSSTDTWDEYSGVTPNQVQKSQTPIRKRTQSKSELGFLTPVVQLTGLQSLNSGSKFLHESPVSPFRLPFSPITNLTQTGPQRKLFADVDQAASQESSAFPSPPISSLIQNENQQKMSTDDLATTQELSEVAELCSGKFSFQSQGTENTNHSDDSTNIDTNNGTSLNNSNITSENTVSYTKTSNQNLEMSEIKEKESDSSAAYNTNIAETSLQILTKISINTNEIKSLDAEDKLISELLNEEEMENFKRKFDSPTNIAPSSVPFSRIIYDSSDEENISFNKTKTKCKKLFFSDDEYSNADESESVEDNEQIALCDEIDGSDSEEPQVVEYDSEENEICLVAEDKPKRMKITDFVENEAELSESEWGSDDEDERGLDELEIEEGDQENMDEEQVKRDLERIHMRRILDDDNEEVKILQELLLDDGDMHGGGRERQFKWRNIELLGNEIGGMPQNDAEIYLDEDEDEEKWRKMRYEREVFLKKQLERRESLDVEEELPVKADSQIIKLGKAAMQRSLANTRNGSVPLEKNTFPSKLDIKLSSTSLLAKRGSFLTRSNQVLERVAEFTKTLTAGVGGSTKNSKNFVFQTVSESTDTVVMNKKRRATDGTPINLKRMRLTGFSPSVEKKEQTKNSKAKKLFSVW